MVGAQRTINMASSLLAVKGNHDDRKHHKEQYKSHGPHFPNKIH